MEIIEIAASKARNLKPAVEYHVNYQDGLDRLIQHFNHSLPVVVNRSTMRCLQPHLLKTYLKDKTIKKIPVLMININPSTEVIYSLAINGGLDNFLSPAPTNTEQIINAIIAAGEELDIIAPLEYIGELLDMFAADEQDDSTNDDEIEPITSRPTPRTDQQNPQNLGDFDIPTLDIDLQILDPSQYEWAGWGQFRATHPTDGIHFYVDDKKFTALEGNPARIFRNKPRCAIEPNYSTNPDKPLALVIADIWRKRTLARVWQREGLPVSVDMNVNREFFQYNLIGVPSGWRSYANRGYVADLDHLTEAYTLAQEHAQTDIIYIVLGGKNVKKMCDKHNWYWIDQESYTFS